MKMTTKAKSIMKLLKQGYSPREVTQRMDASYNYAWKLKNDMAKAKAKAKVKAEAKVEVEAEHELKPGEYIVVEGAKDAQEVDAILDTRASNYGSFLGLSQVTQRLKAVAHNFAGQNNKTFAPDQAEALDLIFTKIGRILNGDPNHVDSWIDIAGYATLVADRLQGKAR